jgi:hypothetical protein
MSQPRIVPTAGLAVNGLFVLSLSFAMFCLFHLLSEQCLFAATSVTVTAIDVDMRLLTVRNNRTGVIDQIKIDSLETLKSLKVGEVFEKPPVDLRSNATHKEVTQFLREPKTCFERCISSRGTTEGQCTYWCATQK